MLNFLLLVQILFHSGFTEHFFFLGVICIIAHESGKLAKFNLDDFCYNPVQEIPVMGHDEHSSGIVEQIGFQPGDGVHIEVVGGLVQKDEIWMGEQKFS